MTWSRRTFLRGAGGIAIGLPFLPSLCARETRAAPGDPPTRLIIYCSPQGFHRDVFWPSGGEMDFTMSSVLQPLEPFRQKLLILSGLSSIYHNHDFGFRSILTAANGNGPSIDQVIAGRLGTVTALRSLELGVRNGTETPGRMCYSGPGLTIPTLSNPRHAYDRIFSSANADPQAVARRTAQRRTVLDAVMEDYRRVSARVSLSEKQIIDAHLTMLEEHGRRLDTVGLSASCVTPPVPAAMGLTFADEAALQIRNLTAAIACDATRVVSLMMSFAGSTERFTWLTPSIDDDGHELAHGNVPDALDKKRRIDRWYAEQFATLLAQLDAIDEGNGTTALDNSVVAWVNELGMMSTFADNHSRRNNAVVLAGGARGYFRTGRMLDLGGRSYGDLLVTLAHAMGFTDLSTFGDEGTGPIDALR